MKKVILLLVVAALAGCMSGCGNETFSANLLPNDKYLVGGGLSIDFTAPSEGTVIYADATSKKILVTKSLLPGEKFEMESLVGNRETLEAFGLDLSKFVPRLYFIPRVERGR